MVLGITWSETGLATILIILRAKNASIIPRRASVPIAFSGIYRLRWDFVWVIIAYVGLTVNIYPRLCLLAMEFRHTSHVFGLRSFQMIWD